jgi:heat shock protein HslJ
MSAQLAGDEWRPIQIGLSRVPSDANMFVQFQGDGQFSGHGGCHRFFGCYKITWRSIKIGSSRRHADGLRGATNGAGNGILYGT